MGTQKNPLNETVLLSIQNIKMLKLMGKKIVTISSLDKQRICVNTQLKSSKKQLKLNACVQKSNSVDRYAITCNVIAYHLVHFVSICVIYKCQLGIDFFLLASTQYNFNL